jgi:pyridoxal phosphate enzyme (YggS family)
VSIAGNIQKLKSELPSHVTLVAVSKTKPAEAILEAYNEGQRIFGENKVQEMTGKYEQLPKDIQWHLIGHLQSNKIKYIAPFVSLIHSVDSPKLLQEINKQAQKNGRTIDCLLQVHIAKEETKFGMDFEEVRELIHSEELMKLENISIRGLMGMATFTENESVIRNEFSSLAAFFRELRSEIPKSEIRNPEFDILSMGMSGDYRIAIEEGSTMIRVGSSIFGSR